jgi:hypothetical protein
MCCGTAAARGATPPRAPVIRYLWPYPSRLLHVDVRRFTRFEAPGHALTGDCPVRSRRVG